MTGSDPPHAARERAAAVPVSAAAAPVSSPRLVREAIMVGPFGLGARSAGPVPLVGPDNGRGPGSVAVVVVPTTLVRSGGRGTAVRYPKPAIRLRRTAPLVHGSPRRGAASRCCLPTPLGGAEAPPPRPPPRCTGRWSPAHGSLPRDRPQALLQHDLDAAVLRLADAIGGLHQRPALAEGLNRDLAAAHALAHQFRRHRLRAPLRQA